VIQVDLDDCGYRDNVASILKAVLEKAGIPQHITNDFL
jgi:hypothetical protein